MQSIVLIIPYFGRLPDDFPVWKMSALKNDTVDFLFFTDVDALQPEKNISVVHMTFPEFRDLFARKFDFPISLEQPYKLCDYKPSYGYVLSDYISQYDFWGHCDIDLIFGDIRRFLTDAVLEQHDKILEHGHFTLYRNDPAINTVFLRSAGYGDYDYKKVYTSPDSLYFDECLGTQLIFRKEGVHTYFNLDCFFDVLPTEKPFRHLRPYDGATIFRYDDGRLFALTQTPDGIRSGELMYAHFQKRKMDNTAFSDRPTAFYLIPNRMIAAPAQTPPEAALFRCRGSRIYRLGRKLRHVREYLTRYRTGNYASFRAYRAERSALHRDMVCAKREIERRRDAI